MSYWDTSALAKLYVPEADSDVFSRKAGLDQLVVTSALTLFEFQRVTLRKEIEGSLPATAAERSLQQLRNAVAAGQSQLVPMDELLAEEFQRLMLRCYRQNPPLPIRTLDALHLAAALLVGEREMVATDHRLREAAILNGLQVYP